MKLLSLICNVLLVACSSILLDTDIGVDDALGILLALVTAQVNIHTITLTHGNVKRDAVTRNMCSLMHVLDLQKEATGNDKYRNGAIPRVALGAFQPLRGDGYDPLGDDGLGGLTEAHPELIDQFWQTRFNINGTSTFQANATSRFIASPLSGADEIIHQLKSLPPKTVTIVALGPLTNIALAIQKVTRSPNSILNFSQDHETMSRARKIVIMGGAVKVPGNMSPLAEFNIFVDAYAADIVFKESNNINVVLVPLDVTHSTQLTKRSLYRRLKSIKDTPIATFSKGILNREFNSKEHPNQAEMFDPLSVAIALDLVTPSNAPFLNLRVEYKDPEKLGWCYLKSDNSSSIKVILSINSPHQFQLDFVNEAFPRRTCHIFSPSVHLI